VLTNNSMTITQVISEFKTGFAPTLTAMPGFKEYGALQIETQTSWVFFWNIFDNQTTSDAASIAAAAFVASGSLNTQIQKVFFVSSTAAFDFYVPTTSGGINGVGIALIVFIFIAIFLALALVWALTKGGEAGYQGAP